MCQTTDPGNLLPIQIIKAAVLAAGKNMCLVAPGYFLTPLAFLCWLIVWPDSFSLSVLVYAFTIEASTGCPGENLKRAALPNFLLNKGKRPGKSFHTNFTFFNKACSGFPGSFIMLVLLLAYREFLGKA